MHPMYPFYDIAKAVHQDRLRTRNEHRRRYRKRYGETAGRNRPPRQ